MCDGIFCLKEKLTAFTAYLAYLPYLGTYMYEIDVRSAVCDEDGWMPDDDDDDEEEDGGLPISDIRIVGIHV